MQKSGSDHDIVSFDLTKAFHRVQNELMLRRLQQLNFHHTAKQWFTSFLSRRKQYVCHGSACSSQLTVPSRVIAGSVLEPVLLAIAIDSLAKELEASFVLFAKDFKAQLNVTKLRKERSQREVNKITKWCVANDMEISVSKSLCIHSREDDASHYKCGMSSLPTAVSFKDLEIIRSKDCGYQYHASFTTSKTRRLCGMIFNNLAIPNCHARWRIYSTSVKPVFSYGSITWNPDGRSSIKTEEKVQRQYTTIIKLRTAAHSFGCTNCKKRKTRQKHDILI